MEIDFQQIRQLWRWDDPKLDILMSKLRPNGITIDDLSQFLGSTPEEITQEINSRPELVMAYNSGQVYLDAKITQALIERAVTTGDPNTITALDKRRKALTIEEQMGMRDLITQIEASGNTEQMSMAMRKAVYKTIVKELMTGNIKNGDLLKLAQMVSDRTDGKVAEKLDVSGTVTLKGILDEISGESAGLPKPEWFDNEVIEHYNTPVIDVDPIQADLDRHE